ncbi:3-hydroxyisobutyrate dehydrogenase [Microbulbifer agarilyticus]|uniref:3-hydroxyisobutyrate dehydrogenase n=1 Tax=Microbulbifer agarilyticus TaxID=260552 RepID=A0A1Q2M643_9GAMM|nr:3-hydroxyisobutyrate dehydrogenase [Microbulbifer agarilyticus]AQQ68119.1 3-hydroxyisobutyrate dehydrogenase [Microbulbifer agarilyticus]
MTTIAFIGLGNMGGPMAANLVAAGHDVRVFDLSDTAMQSLVKLGAKAAKSPFDAAENAQVVISMLPAGQHVAGLYLGDDRAAGLLDTINTDCLVLDCSTIDVDTVRRVQQKAGERGLQFLDAPVSGGVAAAQAGTLTFMCGGEKTGFEQAKSVLSAMGQNIFHAGSHGAGQVAKMCNNMLLAIHMIGTSEALKMGANSGLDPSILSEIMLKSSGRNWSLELYNPYPGVMDSPASRGYQPGFMVDLMTKDLGLAIANAKETNSKVPLGQHAEALYREKQLAGDGKKDFSSILEILEHA